MKVALIYPPTCDPTGPYLSVPMLTAYLRKRIRIRIKEGKDKDKDKDKG